MGILERLFGKKASADSHSRRDAGPDDPTVSQREQEESKRNTRNCDKCGAIISSPKGYLLDAQKDEIEKRRDFVGLALKAGAAGVVANLKPVAFVCDTCLSKEAAAQSVPVDPAIKLMSRERAIHYWNTGEWERPMFSDEFPPESEEKLLPWMNPALEAEWKKKFGTEPPLENYLAIRAEILARFLAQAAHRATLPNNPSVTRPADFVVVIAEKDPNLSWDKYLLGLMKRRMVARIGRTTKVWVIVYRDGAEVWFTHRLLPYVATSVANKLGQDLTQLEFACYIDSKDRGCLTILG